MKSVRLTTEGLRKIEVAALAVFHGVYGREPQTDEKVSIADVSVGDIGRITQYDYANASAGMFEVQFPHCRIICDESMVETEE